MRQESDLIIYQATEVVSKAQRNQELKRVPQSLWKMVGKTPLVKDYIQITVEGIEHLGLHLTVMDELIKEIVPPSIRAIHRVIKRV